MPVPDIALEMPDYAKVTREQRTSHVLSFVRWLQLKKYQYEVTFSLYMLTPTEKFIFNLILFILISLLLTAATFYLPNHVSIIYNRLWYYLHGEFAYSTTASAQAKTSLAADALTITADALKTVSQTVQLVGESASALSREL